LRSPIDGIVISREAEAGSTIGAGTPVFKIANPKTLWVRAYIDERQSGPLQVGQKAVVTLRSTGEQKYAGIVSRIGVVSDRITEERVVYITLDHLPQPFSLGEQAEVQINLTHD
jgi:HlyD family secretion protein